MYKIYKEKSLLRRMIEKLLNVLFFFFLLAVVGFLFRSCCLKIGKSVENSRPTVVHIQHGTGLTIENKPCLIELKPAFEGKNVKVTLSYIPLGSEVNKHMDGKYYLLWTPMPGETLKTTIITYRKNIDPNSKNKFITQKEDIIIFVKNDKNKKYDRKYEKD